VLEGHTNSVLSVAFSPDGRHIVSGSEDKSVWVWDSSIGEVQNVLKGHTNSVLSVAFSPDGRCIVSGSEDNSLWVSNMFLERLALPYIWEKLVDFTHAHKHTGWLLSPSGGISYVCAT
jgi:WD40 repeat protein